MNKSDFKLVLIVAVISIVFIGFYSFSKTDGSSALVYYDGTLIETIDLNIDSFYTVTGFNGDVLLEVKDGKIRVNEENSPLHLCSRQGFIKESYESIVCLPNKIVINISNDLYDAVVK